MPLHPEARALIDRANAAGVVPNHTLTVDEARRQARMRVAMSAGPVIPVHQVYDRQIPGPVGPLNARVYRPDAPGLLPLVVYFHGGGWVLGDLDTGDAFCRGLANEAGCVVLSVEYRLAPEYKYPEPLDDCFAATVWAAANAAELGADISRLVVSGTSAGGNLAAAVTTRARDEGGPALKAQALVVPCMNYAFDTESYAELAEGFTLSRADMQWYWRHYIRNDADGANPWVSPIRANLAGLPPTIIANAEYDPLRDEGKAYAEALRAAGVEVEHTCYPGVLHGFSTMPHIFEAGQQVVRSFAAFLHAHV